MRRSVASEQATKGRRKGDCLLTARKSRKARQKNCVCTGAGSHAQPRLRTSEKPLINSQKSLLKISETPLGRKDFFVERNAEANQNYVK